MRHVVPKEPLDSRMVQGKRVRACKIRMLELRQAFSSIASVSVWKIGGEDGYPTSPILSLKST